MVLLLQAAIAACCNLPQRCCRYNKLQPLAVTCPSAAACLSVAPARLDQDAQGKRHREREREMLPFIIGNHSCIPLCHLQHIIMCTLIHLSKYPARVHLFFSGVSSSSKALVGQGFVRVLFPVSCLSILLKGASRHVSQAAKQSAHTYLMARVCECVHSRNRWNRAWVLPTPALTCEWRLNQNTLLMICDSVFYIRRRCPQYGEYPRS
jgi:hypothetical protein